MRAAERNDAGGQVGTSSAPCGLRRRQVQKPRERTGRRAACLAQPCGCASALVSCLPLNLKTPRLLGAVLWGPEVLRPWVCGCGDCQNMLLSSVQTQSRPRDPSSL